MGLHLIAQRTTRRWLGGMLVICCLLGLTQVAQAASSWYVTPSGAGNRDGRSWANAFPSIQQALEVVQPGDTIYLGDGNYYEVLVSKRHGTATAPIMLRGSSNAVLRGRAGAARVFQLNHDYYLLDGWTINGYDGAGTSSGDYRDKLLYVHGQAEAYGGEVRRGPRGLEVRNMTFLNAGGECIRLRYFVQGANIHHNTIRNCGIYDFVFMAGGKNGEGIYIGTSSEQWGDGKNPTSDPDGANGNHIHHNIINTQGNECAEAKEGATGNIIEYNDCTGGKDIESAGLVARGDGNTFRYNTTYGHAGGGLRFGGHSINGHQYGVNNSVYLNTIYANAAGGIKFESHPQGTVCGNTFTGPNGQTQGNITFGSYASEYRNQVTAACDNTLEPTPTPTATPAAGGASFYLSSSTGGTVAGVTFRDEDVLRYQATTQTWTMYIDASDVGISGDIDGLHLLGDGSILLSLEAAATVPGVGSVDDSDIVRFVPTALGNTTAGAFTLYFDGSDVGLRADSEDVDVIDMTADGKLILSTLGSFTVSGLEGQDEDLIKFSPTRLGATTAGVWSMYVDGSDVGLLSASEDIWGASLDPGTGAIHLSTVGDFAVSGSVSGTAADIFTCMPGSLGNTTICTYSLTWRGANYGFGGEVIDALYIGATGDTVTSAEVASIEGPITEVTPPELNDESVDLDDGQGMEEPAAEELREHLYLPLIAN